MQEPTTPPDPILATLTEVCVTLFNLLPPSERARMRRELGLPLDEHSGKGLGQPRNRARQVRG